MKKCLLVLALLFSVFTSFSQFTNTRSQSNPNTLEIWGEKNSDYKLSGLKGYHISAWFPDTLSANNYLLIRNIPNIFIAVGNEEVYKRSYDAKRWILIGGNNCRGTQLISGSITWSGSGLVYDATDLDYYIICSRYFANATTLTLSVADPTYARIDKFYADITGTIGVITGTPSANPQEPAVNPLSQIDMGFVYIPAGSTVPAGTTQTVIYNENVEWSGTSDVPSINFSYGTNPYIGSVSTYLPNAPNSSYVEWQSNGTDYLFSEAQYLKFWVRLNANFSTEPLSFLDVTFEYTDVTVSQTLSVGNGDYNMDYSLINQWQLVSIPLTGLTTFGTDFNEVHFVINSAPTSFQLDYVYLLETATIPPVISSGWSLNLNTGTNPTTNGIGTSDSVALAMKTNSQTRLIIPANGIVELSNDELDQQLLTIRNDTIYKTNIPTAYGTLPIVVEVRNDSTFITCPTCDTTGGSGWSLTGNAGTTPGTNFVGTTDLVGLRFRTNNTNSGQINRTNFSTGFGVETLNSNTGSFNNAFGWNAGFSNTTGSENNSFGHSSQYKTTTGINNNSFGYSSLYENIAGSENNAFGYRALGQSVSGTMNTAMGDLALITLTTGSRNTAIGANADVTSSSVDSSIAIGFEASAGTKQIAFSPHVNQIKATGITGASNSGYVLTTNGSGIATFQAAGGGSVLTGNLLYVDAVNGNDGTGALGDFTKPYLTPLAAFTSATSGYTIIVRPGVYSLSISSNAMLKDGVNWYFMPGSIFIANAAADGTMFSDNLGAVSCSVTGYGQFYDTLGGISKILEIASSGSNVYFECNSMTVGNGDIDHCIYQADGTLTVNVRGTLESKSYDAISIVGGTLNLTADKIIATGTAEGNAIEITGGNVNIKCREYVSEGDYDAFGSTSAIYWSGGNAYIEGNGVAELSDGLVVASNGTGVLTLRGKLTSTSKTAVVYLSAASGKTLINQATLISNTSFDSIDAPSAQTVVSYGSFANKAVDANITIQGILTIGSYVQ